MGHYNHTHYRDQLNLNLSMNPNPLVIPPYALSKGINQ